jgi:hypothetical protein
MVERSRRRREMNPMATTRMLLTTAVLAAVAVLMTAPAHAYFADAGGGGSSGAASVPTPTTGGLDPAIQTAINARESSLAQPIPYLSHGIGVDQTLFGAQGSGDVDESRFAGDVAAGQSTEPLVGHVDESRFAADVARASALDSTQSSSGTTDVDWTRIGLASGLAAFLALGIASLYLTARQRRGGVALP